MVKINVLISVTPCILNPVLDSPSFGISQFHLRMRGICRSKLYNYRYHFVAINITSDICQINKTYPVAVLQIAE
jgi:hypothetical protein